MKKIWLLIIFLIIGTLFFLIWIQDEYECPEEGRDNCMIDVIDKQNGIVDINICEEIQNSEKRDICYFRLAQYKSGKVQLDLCRKINSTNPEDYYNRDYCFLQAALEDEDLEICKLINSSVQKRLCVESLNNS